MNRKHSMGLVSFALLGLSSVLAAERVRLVEGTPIQVRLKADMSADQLQVGNRVDLEVSQPVVVRGLIVIPEGAAAWGGVQSTKKKEIRFDIEGIKLVNQTEIKLRTIAEKSKKPGKDQLKVDSAVAAKGSEFTAYVDEDIDLDGAPGPMATATAPKPVAPAATPSKKLTPPLMDPPRRAPEPAVEAPAVSAVSKPVSPPSAVITRPSPASQPVETPAATTPPPAAPTPAPAPVTASPAAPPAAGSQEVNPATERVAVECYSEPSGADILIDGNFVGNTPSILKVPIGSHRMETQLRGHKTVRQSLELMTGMGIRTIRVTLEKSE